MFDPIRWQGRARDLLLEDGWHGATDDATFGDGLSILDQIDRLPARLTVDNRRKLVDLQSRFRRLRSGR
jgi:hypothetical protein